MNSLKAVVKLNNTLAIVIPTYNRPEILKENLKLILDECKRHSLAIFISDDSTDMQTDSIVQELKSQYQFIFYSKNTPSLGHDKNLLSALKLPDSDYVWLLGDSIIINKYGISEILNTIAIEKSDIIMMNAEGRGLNYPSNKYQNCKDVFLKFGWHGTMTGVTVFSRKSILLSNKIDFFTPKNFPLFTLIFYYLSSHCSFYWVNSKIVKSNKKKKSYWSDNIFSVFIDDWGNAVRNLPESYDRISQKKVIINHSKKTSIFGVKSLLHLRGQGLYNWKKYKEYADTLPLHSNLRKIVLVAIALFPRIIIKIGYKVLSKK